MDLISFSDICKIYCSVAEKLNDKNQKVKNNTDTHVKVTSDLTDVSATLVSL